MSSLSDNPLFRLLMRRNFSARQVGLLCVYIGGFFGFLMFSRHFPSNFMEILLLTALAWGIGEFVVCWMAADHTFSTWGAMRERGVVRELVVSRMGGREVAGAIIVSTTLFIGIAVLVWLGTGLLTPGSEVHQRDLGAAAYPGIYASFMVLLPIVMALNHWATAFAASGHCLRRCVERDVKSRGEGMTWVFATAELAICLYRILLIAVLVGLVLCLEFGSLAPQFLLRRVTPVGVQIHCLAVVILCAGMVVSLMRLYRRSAPGSGALMLGTADGIFCTLIGFVGTFGLTNSINLVTRPVPMGLISPLQFYLRAFYFGNFPLCVALLSVGVGLKLLWGWSAWRGAADAIEEQEWGCSG